MVDSSAEVRKCLENERELLEDSNNLGAENGYLRY
jgi:hypothetical protein